MIMAALFLQGNSNWKAIQACQYYPILLRSLAPYLFSSIGNSPNYRRNESLDIY